jgi:Autographiviridae endonuclease VII
VRQVYHPHKYYCKKCEAARRRDYTRRRREHIGDEAWLAQRRAEDAAFRERHKHRLRNKHTTKKFGITEEHYHALFVEQGGLCAICGEQPGERRLAIDHNHETGIVRGLLCMKCNTALGSLGDDVAGVQRALSYLERNAC